MKPPRLPLVIVSLVLGFPFFSYQAWTSARILLEADGNRQKTFLAAVGGAGQVVFLVALVFVAVRLARAHRRGTHAGKETR